MSAPVIVVFGAGGGTGRAAVARALSLGHTVRAVVRNPEGKDFAPGVEVLAGDVSDAHSVAVALRGATGVIFCAATSQYFGADAVDHQGVRNVAHAARASETVERVVLISSAFVSPHQFWSPVRLILNIVKWRLMDAKYEGEQALRRSGVSYTVVRPGRLLDAVEGPECAWRVEQGDMLKGGGGIPRAEVAAIAVAALFDSGADRVTFEVTRTSPPEPPSTAQQIYGGRLAAVFRGLVKDAPVA